MSKPLSIVVIGTFDTKGLEHRFVADQIRAGGHCPLLIDVGTGGTSTIEADIGRDEVFQAPG